MPTRPDPQYPRPDIMVAPAGPAAASVEPRFTHEFSVTCICPVDGDRDVYEVTVETGSVIPVEDIIAATLSLSQTPIFQEQFTMRLARQIAARVRTVGYHSGVKTTCWS